MSMNNNELFRDNLRDAHWLGEVVDIMKTHFFKVEFE